MSEIKNVIYELNDKLIMLDSDLALLFGISGAKEINRIARNNIRLFPSDNYFQLAYVEYKKIVLQNESLERNYNEFNNHLPYAFTEYAVYMLSTLIKTSKSIDICIKIIDTFINAKRYIANNLNLINDLAVNSMDISSDLYSGGGTYSLFKEFDRINKYNKNYIFYNGRIHEYTALMSMLIVNAEKDIVIVDEFIDTELLDIVNKLSVNILIIVTKKKIENKVNFNNNINVKYNELFSDKFILIDNKILYHLHFPTNKDAVKCISVNIIKEKELINSFRSKLFLS